MQSLLDFLLFSMATWRITFAFHTEAGPFQVLARFRSLCDARILHDQDGEPYSYPAGSPFACMGCLSVWVGTFLFLALLAGGSVVQSLIWVWAAAAVVKILNDVVYRGNS